MADHGENDVAGGGEVSWGLGERGAEGEEGGGSRGGAGVDGNGVAGGDESGDHGPAHNADSYPSYAGTGRGYGCRVMTAHIFLEYTISTQLFSTLRELS